MILILCQFSVKYIFVSHVSRRRPDEFEPEMSVGLIYGKRVPAEKTFGSAVVDVEVQIDFLALLVFDFMLVDCLVIFLVRYDRKPKSSGLLFVVGHPEHALTLPHE
jgi:hypothetical protein